MATSRSSSPPAAASGHWPCLREAGPSACVLTVAVQPNARRTEATGLHEGALRIRLAAQPIEGQANDALVQWLARELGLAKRDVRLKRGAAARHKQVEVDAALAVVQAWLQRTLGAPPPG